jgi:hypothetical protein
LQRPRGRGLFYNDKLDLNQGAYLTEAPPRLQAVLDAAYLKHTGQHLPKIPTPASSSALLADGLPADEYDITEDVSVGARHNEPVWIWAPGEQAVYWDELYESGTMALGWNEIGDFQKYRTVDDFKRALEGSMGSEKDQDRTQGCASTLSTPSSREILFSPSVVGGPSSGAAS